jgi:sugar phosphate isomerase/epimerase
VTVGPPSPSFGVTLFSFTDDWLSGTYDLASLLGRVAADGLGPAVELVAFQSFRPPGPTPDEVRAFRESTERLGLVPTCMGVDADHAVRAGGWLTDDEVTSSLETQLRQAHELGFTVARTTLGLAGPVAERLLPLLERLDLVLTVEVQGSARPDGPDVGRWLAELERLGSPQLGVTLDTSVAMPRLPATFVRHLVERGAPSRLLDALAELWDGGTWGPRHLGRLVELCRQEAAGDDVAETVTASLIRFGRSGADDWRHLVPWTRHVHAKFWDWADPALDVAGPQSAVLGLLADAGYDGAVSSEWGGSAWLDASEADAFALTRDHLALLRSF